MEGAPEQKRLFYALSVDLLLTLGGHLILYLGINGGDDGARTRDLCRDIESNSRNF